MPENEDDWAGCGCDDCRQRYGKQPSKKQRRKALIAELEAEVEAQKAKQAALVEQRTTAEGKQADVYDALADAGFVWTGTSAPDRIRQLRHGLLPLTTARRNIRWVTVDQVRTLAREIGWMATGIRDLCPEHAQAGRIGA